MSRTLYPAIDIRDGRVASMFAAVVRRGRCAGAQFHPERSAAVGARILENFLAGATA